jgi:hypothetical protein
MDRNTNNSINTYLTRFQIHQDWIGEATNQHPGEFSNRKLYSFDI